MTTEDCSFGQTNNWCMISALLQLPQPAEHAEV